MIKKYILASLVAISLPAMVAFAATPVLTATGSGDGSNVTVNVTGADAMAPIVLYFNGATTGTLQSTTIGTTDANGSFSGSINTNDRGISSSIPVYVLVNGYQSGTVSWPYTSAASSTLTFSPSNPSVTAGQNSTVTISGSNGSYYVSSNSNTNGVTATINGNTLTLNGQAAGTAVVTICSTSGVCSPLNVTTNATAGTMLSQSSINLTPGQSGMITISGSQAPYTVTTTSGNGITTGISGSNLTVSGNATGTTVLSVCSATGSCMPFSVMINSATQTTTSPLTAWVPLAIGQTMMLSVSGGTGNYTLQSQASSPVAAGMSGNTLTVTGMVFGQSTINVCSSGTACTPFTFVVNAPATTPTPTPTKFYFSNALSLGMSGNEVLELQNRLMAEGYFSATPTGYFGPVTMASVRAYQAAKGLDQVGMVGPMTRARLNQ